MLICVYDVYNLQMNSKELIKLLEKDGLGIAGLKRLTSRF
jgi:hypothetical protein